MRDLVLQGTRGRWRKLRAGPALLLGLLPSLSVGCAGWPAIGLPCSDVRGCARESAFARPLVDSELTLVALGDFGASEGGRNREVAEALRRYFEERHTAPDGVLLLGDNFYPNGLIGAETPCRPNRHGPPDEPIAGQIAEVLDPYDFLRRQTTTWAIPGNHDHACPELGGLRNQAVIDRWLSPPRAWGDGWRALSGLPVELMRTPLIQVIALDTTPMIADRRFLDAAARRLEELLDRSPARWRLVAGHHPLYANGDHDGAWWEGAILKTLYYPSHLLIFPPFLLYDGQATYECSYRRYRKRLESVFARHRVDVFLAGHEHALEWLRPSRPGQPFTLISGAGARCENIMQRRNTAFGAAKNGFAVLAASEQRLRVEIVATTPCHRLEECARPTTPGAPHTLFATALAAPRSRQDGS